MNKLIIIPIGLMALALLLSYHIGYASNNAAGNNSMYKDLEPIYLSKLSKPQWNDTRTWEMPLLAPPTPEELESDAPCSVVANRNVRYLRSQGYMATKVIVGNLNNKSHVLTGLLLLFDSSGELLSPEEFDGYYDFRYRATVDGILWGVHENIVPDDWNYTDFDCRCWRKEA